MKWHRLVIVFPCILSLGACTFSGLPADAELSNLPEEQATQLCEATQRYRDENLSEEEVNTFLCNLLADVAGEVASASGNDHEAACEESRQTCLEQGADESEAADCERAAARFEDCDEATVEMYESCVREQIADIKTANEEFTCAERYFDPREEAKEADGEQSACEAYATACGLPRVPRFAAP